MQPPHIHPAVLPAVIGFLLMILAAGLLAEKSHEGHLPERNDRGSENAPAAAGFLAGAVIFVTALFGNAAGPKSAIAAFRRNARGTMPCCPAMV